MAVEYLKNSVLEAMIVQYRKKYRTRKSKPVDYKEAYANLANAFLILSERLIKGFKFQLIDVEDALQEGVIISFEKLHHFNPEKGKAFSFFTQIILNHFKQLYRHAKGFNELKIKYTEHLMAKDKNISADYKKGKKKYNHKSGSEYFETYDGDY